LLNLLIQYNLQACMNQLTFLLRQFIPKEKADSSKKKDKYAALGQKKPKNTIIFLFINQNKEKQTLTGDTHLN